MKKLLIFLFLLSSFAAMSQNPTVDSLKFMDDRGKLWKLISYGSDSVDVNGVMLYSGIASTINHWQTAGAGFIQPNPNTLKVKIPGIGAYYTGAGSILTKNLLIRTDTKEIFYSSNTTVTSFLIQHDTLINWYPMNIVAGTATGTVTVYMDSIARFNQAITVKSESDFPVVIKSLEGLLFDALDSVTLAKNEWITLSPATTKFTSNGNTWVTDTSLFYTKTQADAEFVTDATRDSLFRYSVYSSGNNNIEVLATKRGITASLANTNEFTFTLPTGVDLISAKIRVENFSSVVCIMSGKLGAASMATRWMPSVSAWREDTGAALMGATSRMDLSIFSKFYITGLISTSKCQVRIVF